MKIKVSYPNEDVFQKALSSCGYSIDFTFPGKGTNNDSFIISPDSSPPLVFRISNSKSHILIKNVKMGGLELYKCENITILKSNFETFNIFHSQNCFLDFNHLGKRVYIMNSEEIIVQNSILGKLKLIKSDIEISNNEIQVLEVLKSSDSKIISNQIDSLIAKRSYQYKELYKMNKVKEVFIK